MESTPTSILATRPTLKAAALQRTAHGGSYVTSRQVLPSHLAKGHQRRFEFRDGSCGSGNQNGPERGWRKVVLRVVVIQGLRKSLKRYSQCFCNGAQKQPNDGGNASLAI